MAKKTTKRKQREQLAANRVLGYYQEDYIIQFIEATGVEVNKEVFSNTALLDPEGFALAKTAIETAIEKAEEIGGFDVEFLENVLSDCFYNDEEKTSYSNNKEAKRLAAFNTNMQEILERLAALESRVDQLEQENKELKEQIAELTEAQEEGEWASIPDIENYEINSNESIGIRNKKSGRVLKQYSTLKGVYVKIKGKRVYIKEKYKSVFRNINRLDQVAQSTIKIE